MIVGKEGSTKIVDFMTPGAGVVELGCGHIGDIVKMLYFLKNFYSTHLQWADYIEQSMWWSGGGVTLRESYGIPEYWLKSIVYIICLIILKTSLRGDRKGYVDKKGEG